MGVVFDKLLGKPLLHNHGILAFSDFGSLPIAGLTYRGYLVYVYGSDRALWDSIVSNWNDTDTNWNDTTDSSDKLYLCHRMSTGDYEWLDLTAALNVGLWDQT